MFLPFHYTSVPYVPPFPLHISALYYSLSITHQYPMFLPFHYTLVPYIPPFPVFQRIFTGGMRGGGGKKLISQAQVMGGISKAITRTQNCNQSLIAMAPNLPLIHLNLSLITTEMSEAKGNPILQQKLQQK